MALLEIPEPGTSAKEAKAVAVKLGVLRVRAAVLTGVCDELFAWCVSFVCLLRMLMLLSRMLRLCIALVAACLGVKLGLLRVRTAVLTGVSDELFAWCVIFSLKTAYNVFRDEGCFVIKHNDQVRHVLIKIKVSCSSLFSVQPHCAPPRQCGLAAGTPSGCMVICQASGPKELVPS